MIAFVWEFDVKPDSQEAFEVIYGAGGEWTAVARRSRSYLGSSFLKNQNQPTRYLLTEYWSEMIVYERHQEDLRNEIADLTARRDTLVVSVRPLGMFSALDVPGRVAVGR